MSLATVRGGVVTVQRVTATAAGIEVLFRAPVQHIQIAVVTPIPVNIYFTEADFNNGANFITRSEWEGPLEAGKFWLQSTGANVVMEVVMFHRRG